MAPAEHTTAAPPLSLADCTWPVYDTAPGCLWCVCVCMCVCVCVCVACVRACVCVKDVIRDKFFFSVN